MENNSQKWYGDSFGRWYERFHHNFKNVWTADTTVLAALLIFIGELYRVYVKIDAQGVECRILPQLCYGIAQKSAHCCR